MLDQGDSSPVFHLSTVRYARYGSPSVLFQLESTQFVLRDHLTDATDTLVEPLSSHFCISFSYFLPGLLRRLEAEGIPVHQVAGSRSSLVVASKERSYVPRRCGGPSFQMCYLLFI